ncbi:hypothetical protein HUS23_08120 [Ectothiorhodospiraceae bacterium 2226]|nr:hypothetical protein HUS23_08120 [Ectothiorhodospiraceae bacterium 2226]
MDKVFRQLVLASVFLYTFVWFSPYFSYLWMDENVVEMLVIYGGYGAVFPHEQHSTFFLIFDAVTYVGFVLSSIGMLFFQAIARAIFTLLIVISQVMVLVSGTVVTIEGIAFLESVLSMMDGAILALAYLSPLSNRFSPRSVG